VRISDVHISLTVAQIEEDAIVPNQLEETLYEAICQALDGQTFELAPIRITKVAEFGAASTDSNESGAPKKNWDYYKAKYNITGEFSQDADPGDENCLYCPTRGTCTNCARRHGLTPGDLF
jgi:hypothetical protein